MVTGPEDPKANAHSPNESISLPGLSWSTMRWPSSRMPMPATMTPLTPVPTNIPNIIWEISMETTDVPANYRNFTFDTTNTRLSDARFDANWTKAVIMNRKECLGLPYTSTEYRMISV